tara:strand:- start:425 stop:1765 length:1341 start_codon:yes stop_codon:yes gene_type:complete
VARDSLGNTPQLNIAIVGTGISGLAAAWLLNQKHNVTIFEKNEYIGGHSHTVCAHDGTNKLSIDTGFIVYNEANYPNLTALFKHLNVPTTESSMSFAASLEDGSFEYSGTDLNSLLGQRANLFRPRFWRMIAGIARFYSDAPRFFENESNLSLTLSQFLEKRNYDPSFVRDHLLPMGAAIWSTTTQEISEYPASSFIRFFQSHGLLNLTNRPKWRTVLGGSAEYVRRMTDTFFDKIFLDHVLSIHRTDSGVKLITSKGENYRFDHVVLATHADEALALLVDPCDFEVKVLSPWRYTKNEVVLHNEPSLMPKERRTWSSWNFVSTRHQEQGLCVTYWMNKLQRLNTTKQFFITLNPFLNISPDKIVSRHEYTHPYFNEDTLKTQKNLWAIQGIKRTWYCGSYFGFGFHEDGLQSALAVAEQLGEVRRPWTVVGENNRLTITSSMRKT